MAESLTVLQVHLESDGSAVLATCRSLAGEELGTIPRQWEDTLQELEDGVKGREGSQSVLKQRPFLKDFTPHEVGLDGRRSRCLLRFGAPKAFWNKDSGEDEIRR